MKLPKSELKANYYALALIICGYAKTGTEALRIMGLTQNNNTIIEDSYTMEVK